MPGQVAAAITPTDPQTGHTYGIGSIGPWMPNYWQRLAETAWLHNQSGNVPTAFSTALNHIPSEQRAGLPNYLQQWISGLGAAPATSTPIATPTPTPTASPLAGASPSLPNANPIQSAIPTVGHLPSGPSDMQNQPQQLSPLAQLFNFPTLRTKKPAQSTGGTGPVGVGQYNENFWNAWRV